jgi:methyl coenzyme M reductase subunit C
MPPVSVKDLCALMVDRAADPATMGTVVDILCGVDRPEFARSRSLDQQVT